MYMNRTKYDDCAYTQELRSSSSALSYMLDTVKFNNCKKCRNELGLVGGSAVSHTTGNIVDLEGDLQGRNRLNSHCANYKWLPNGKAFVQGKDAGLCIRKYPKVSTQATHLPACQMHDFAPIPQAPPLKPFKCGRQ